MQRLIELKNQPNSPNQAKTDKLGALPKMSAVSAVAAAGAASSVNAASGVQATSGVQAASAVAAASPKIKTQTAPSLLDQLLGEPLYLAAVAALLLLGGLAVWLKRRPKGKSKSDSSAEDIGSASGRMAAPIAPSPDTGYFTTTMVDAGSSNKPATDDVDPISEADLFLNFGRDEQAEEILKDALAKNPANHQIHLKLLSIYLNRRDVAAFSAIASQLQKSGDTKAWEQAAKMGLKLEPNNPMYGADSSSAAAPVMANTKDTKNSKDTEVIFDVGIAKKQPAAMDFDLGLATAKVPATAVGPQHDSTLIMNAPMDFDVTGSRPVALNTEAVEPSATQLDDLIFDVTAGHEAVAAAPKEEAKRDDEVKPDDDLTFALDIPGIEKFAPPPPPAPAKPPMEINFSEISLNLNQPGAAGATVAADGKDAHWHDVATKLDLASAYKEMGDAAGAREILEEVVRDGDDEQRAAANALMQQLG